MVELPSYDEEEHVVENYDLELMPEITTEKGDTGKLVEYREDEGKAILEMDFRHIVEYSEEDIREDMEEVMEELYEKARNYD